MLSTVVLVLLDAHGQTFILRKKCTHYLLNSTLKQNKQTNKNYDICIQSHHFAANRRGKSGISNRFYFPELQKPLQMLIAVMKLKDVCFGREALINIDNNK